MRAFVLTLLTAWCLAPLVRAAEAPMTGPQFAAFAQGRTLGYSVKGKLYGLERYLPGQRVIWQFLGQRCLSGHWYDTGDRICFVYGVHEPQCWQFFKAGAGLRARFMGEAGSAPVAVGESDRPLDCPAAGPGV